MGLSDFFSTPRTNVVASILQFPAIDTDAMIRKMRLRERAQEQARRDLPEANSQAFDAVEQEIVNEIENESKTQYNHYLSHQKTYADRANDAGIQALILKIGAIAPNAAADFERNTRVGTGDLYALKRDVIQTEKELNRFRSANRLTRPVRDIGSRTKKIGLLILILAVESLLNGFFLAKGNVFGLAGGIFEALLIAAINVFVGATVGRFVFPGLAHRNWFVKFIAMLGTVIYFAAAIGFNLAVAHYRNAVTADPFDASIIAYGTLLKDPIGIHDLQSWSLFLFGFFFSLIAAYDGLRMDDPYPGYGHRMRQNLSALHNYTDMKDELLGELEEIKKDADKAMEDLTQTIVSRRGEFEYVVMKSRSLKSEMQQYFSHLESAANTLLRFYRDQNRTHRKSSAPARFDATWTCTRPSLDDEIIADPTRRALDEALRKAIEEAPQQQENLNSAYTKALATYLKIDDLVE